jgi:pimeloyl-ACP methyl ester carboxylesterase
MSHPVVRRISRPIQRVIERTERFAPSADVVLPGRLAPDRMYPAGESGVSVRMLLTRSGLRVRAVESGPAAGRPVVLVHGWGASAYTWRHQIPALAWKGYRAIAVDLKGHGLTDKPEGPGEYSLPAMLAHVREVLDALEVERPVMVAQSMTGALALELALEAAPRVDRVALVNPVGLCDMPIIPVAAAVTSPRPAERFAPWLMPRWTFSTGLRFCYGSPWRVSERAVDEYWAPTQFPGYARAMRALVHEFRWPPLTEAQLASLRVPTLVVLGTRDRVVRGARSVAERLAGVRVAVVEGGGHAVNEEHPDRVNRALLDFLAG